MHANGMVTVWLDVAKEHDQELNDWYEREHLADVVDIDGFISGFRYFSPDAPHRFLVLYETLDETVESGPGFRGIVARPTRWTLNIRSMFKKQMRNNYRRRIDTGAAATPGAIVAVHSNAVPDSAQGELFVKTTAGCTRYRAFENAEQPNAWLEVYDFTGTDAAHASLPSRADSRSAVYRAIGEPYIRGPA